MKPNTIVIRPATGIVTMAAQPSGTPTGAAPTQTPAGSAGQSAASVTVDVSGVAQDVTSQGVAAVPPSTNGPWWETMPQHMQLPAGAYTPDLSKLDAMMQSIEIK